MIIEFSSFSSRLETISGTGSPYFLRALSQQISRSKSSEPSITGGKLPSGTGKTSLAYAWGKFVEQDSCVSSVEPSWREKSDFLGYFNEFSKKFNETSIDLSPKNISNHDMGTIFEELIRKLIRNNASKFENYISKMQKSTMQEMGIQGYDDCLDF